MAVTSIKDADIDLEPVKATPVADADIDLEPHGDNLSLGKGIADTAKTYLKSVAAVPVLGYEQVRHPIDTLKTMASGVPSIPGAMKDRAVEDYESVKEDLKKRSQTSDYWQQFLRGGRAALTTMASPLDILVGVPYEQTAGKVVENATGGMINKREAALAPQVIAGMKILPESVKEGAKDAAGAVKSGLKTIKDEIKPNLVKVKTPEEKAADLVVKKFEEGAKTGAPSLSKAIATVKESQARGKPMSLSDVDNIRVQGLAGSVARLPGPGRDLAKRILDERDKKAGDRLAGDINQYFAKNSSYQTVQTLAKTRSEQSKPKYEKALAGGSLAPLEKQFENSFAETSKKSDALHKDINQQLNRITQLRGKLATTNDVYSRAGVQSSLKKAEADLAKMEGDLHVVHEEKASALEALRGSRADKTANAPGAVWSPHLARLMKNPEMQRGIRAGMRIERNHADAANRPFNIHEYAIIGGTPEEPIIGKVPNMKLIAMAKEGLDSLLLNDKGMRDEKTGRLTKEGLSVDALRRAVLTEVDRLNPDWKDARDTWAGPSRQMDMVLWGEKVFKRSPDENVADLKDMTKSEKEFARIGAGDMLRMRMLDTGFKGDEAKSILKSEGAKMRLRPLFDSDKDFNEFVNAVTDERTMFENRFEKLGGSHSAQRLAEDSTNAIDALADAAKAAKDVYSFNVVNMLKTLNNLYQNRQLRQAPELQEAIAKLLFDPNVDFDKLAEIAEKKNAPTK